jgi:ribosomal protein S18 acetylase RimI-like enzyme
VTGVVLRTGNEVALSSLLELYTAVGWAAYTREECRDDLEKAVSNSSFVVSAWHNDTLVGLVRALSDDVSICYVQDILVHPDYQRCDIGEQLICACMTRYVHVRSKVLMTDDEERQRLFYEKAGLRNIKNINAVDLNVYVQMAELA